jgi:hypothetical protein
MTELTERVWPSRVCRQALQPSSIGGFPNIHPGSCVSNCILVMLTVGLISVLKRSLDVDDIQSLIYGIE